MRKLIFNVPDETTKEQAYRAAKILGCEVEIYIDHSLTEYRAKEREEPQRNGIGRGEERRRESQCSSGCSLKVKAANET